MAVSPDEHSSRRLLAPWQPVDDWSTLEGRTAEFHRHGHLIDSGTVEAVTPDGEILWLKLDGALPRRILEKAPDIHARLAPNH